MKKFLARYFNSWWLPALVYVCLLGFLTITTFSRWKTPPILTFVLFCIAGIAFWGIVAASIWNLVRKRWKLGVINLLLVFSCGVATVALSLLFFISTFGPSKDGFADNLTIPEGIEIADPDRDTTGTWDINIPKVSDEFQDTVRKALAVRGNNTTQFMPVMPSLRKASTDHPDTFSDYIEASPDWHVFMNQSDRFASRLWSCGGGRGKKGSYISKPSSDDDDFQIRCLLCLDRQQESRHSVQHVQEGIKPAKPKMSMGNNLHESRVMIECGGVWVEIFEQSGNRERRVTKATVALLEQEFSEFLRNPADAVAAAQARTRELARRLAGEGNQPFRLVTGSQPGIYNVVYSLNPGEPGTVYLKAFEVSKGTPLSVDELKRGSKTRMIWSTDPSERFGVSEGFMISEGDWGKPYAARFEVWFKPDSGNSDRKLAERIFRIEGWQR